MFNRWVITGANGYLGRELCRGLRVKGDEVLGFVRDLESCKFLESAGIECQTYRGISSALSSGDVLVHCAGKTGSTGDWQEFSKVNIDLTVSLLDYAINSGVSCFIYVSSVAAIGYKNRFQNGMIDESSPPALVEGELYGRSKLHAESALQKRAKGTSTRVVILRPGLIYGRRTFSAPKKWFQRGLIFDSDQRVPLVHIYNFLEAVIRVADNPQVDGVFFVIDDEQPTLRQLNNYKLQKGLIRYLPWQIGKPGFWLLNFAQFIVGKMRGRKNYHQKGFVLSQYYFHTRRLVYSTAKLRKMTGWSPYICLNDGLKDCYERRNK